MKQGGVCKGKEAPGKGPGLHREIFLLIRSNSNVLVHSFVTHFCGGKMTYERSRRELLDREGWKADKYLVE
ncbi:MAG: hypothetical protein WAM08_03785 [Candidatus Acidiferrales bacterium]